MNTIKTWEERMSTSGRRECEALAVELMQMEIAEYRALAARATPAQPVQPSLREAIEAMDRAKKLPIWDNDVPHKLHVELDIIFKALCAQPSPSSVGAAIRALPLPEVKILHHGDLTSWESECFARGALAMRSEAAALAEQVQGQRDTERINLLEAETVDTIYLDDGRIIDVGGKHAGDLRKAIDAFAAPSIAQDGQKSEGV